MGRRHVTIHREYRLWWLAIHLPEIHGCLDGRGIIHSGLFQSHINGHFAANELFGATRKPEKMRCKSSIISSGNFWAALKSEFCIFEEHRGFPNGMSNYKSSILFFLIQLRGTCDQLKSGHMPIVCIVRFFYLAQYFGRDARKKKEV